MGDLRHVIRVDIDVQNATPWGSAFKDRLGRSGALGDLLKELNKQHPNGTYCYPTQGMAAALQHRLRDPHTRERLRRRAGIPPDYLLSTEEMARVGAIGGIMGDLAERLDAAFADAFGELRRAQQLPDLSDEYDEAAQLYIRRAVAVFKAAWSRNVMRVARDLGWVLERDFSIRAPKLVARLVVQALGIPPDQMKPRHVRYLCGW